MGSSGRRSARPRRGDPDVLVGSVARYDRGRADRTGAPEIVLAEGKTLAQLRAILRGLRKAGRGAVVSRLDPSQSRGLGRTARTERWPLRLRAGGRVAVLLGPLGGGRPAGLVALVTAGTADHAVASECREVLRALGIRTALEYDVGVAGLHRLLAAVARLERRRPDVYLAFAGREGALPTVLAGLVRAPVVGVPTSVGYGRGGRGEAALTAMLQSCAPVAVVNIDAGVPAALFAAQLLASRVRGPVGALP